jgi:hypothetical protein
LITDPKCRGIERDVQDAFALEASRLRLKIHQGRANRYPFHIMGRRCADSLTAPPIRRST